MARPQKFRHDREALKQPHIAVQLAGHVLGIEELRSQAKAIQDEIADAYDTLDGDGFEKAMVRKLVGLRAKDFTKRQDEEEGLAIYEEAVERGVSLAHTRRKLETADTGADITMRHTAIATNLPPHDEDGVVFEDEPETADETPSGMESGSDDHSGDEIVTNEGESHVDRSATARTSTGETLVIDESIDGNTSGPDAKWAPDQVSEHVGDECTEQPEDGLSASGDNSEIDHSAASSQVADTAAGEVVPPSSSAALSSTRHQTLTGDGGHLSEPSSDAGVGVRAASADIDAAKSEQAATISEADVPDFLKRKEGCLDHVGCKVKTYSILCARCAAERARARAA